MFGSQQIFRNLASKLFIFFAIIDAFSIYFSGWLTYSFYVDEPQLVTKYQDAIQLAIIINFFVFFAFKLYWLSTRVILRRHMIELAKGWLTFILILMGVAFLFKEGATFSRFWFAAFVFTYFFALISNRFIIFSLFDLMRASGINQRTIAIVGCNETAQQLQSRLQKSLWTGYQIRYLWRTKAEGSVITQTNLTIMDIPNDLATFIRKNQIDEIWFVLPLKEIDTIKELMFHFRELALPLRMMLNADEFAFFEYSITDIAGFPALNLNESPIQGLNRILKNIEDGLLAIVILTLITPLLIAIGIGIKITSQGPILFKQKRLGSDGKIIKVYKFRTMYLHEEEGVKQATLHDQRITPIGKWLRKTSLDELPQFINVLQGRMSIVGPRPHALSHNDEYKKMIYAYMQRHRVKPGITGWAQVNGWRGETSTLAKMEKRVEFDLYYINNWSIAFDLKIIFLTLFKGFIHQNAY